jgi:hypothetical protein
MNYAGSCQIAGFGRSISGVEPLGPATTELLIRRCIQKFPDWPPGARTAIGALVSLFSE